MTAKRWLAIGRSRYRSLGPQVPVRVSMTTYPVRAKSARQAVESILFGSQVRPTAITLVLAAEEFGGTSVPDELLGLVGEERLGVELLWVDRTTRSFQKLVPVLERHPHDTIVTADDDILYPARWLAGLVRTSAQRPGAVVGHRVLRVRSEATRRLAPYGGWRAAEPGTPPDMLFPTGVGGVLYPAGSLDSGVTDMKLALAITPTGDDIWFHAMRLLARTEAIATTPIPLDAPSTRHTGNRNGLWGDNQHGLDDEHLKMVYDHFDLWRYVSPSASPSGGRGDF